MPTPSSLVAIRAHGTRRPLFCVHPIGGHLTAYMQLAALLSPEQPVWGLRSRAVLDPASEHTSLDAMVTDYVGLIAGTHGGPYRLLGWSMGGFLAHAIACRLEAAGADVELVGMIAPPARVDPLRENEVDALALQMALQIFHPDPPARAVVRGAMSSGEWPPSGSLAAWAVARGLLPADGVALAEFDAAAALLPIHHALLIRSQLGVCRAPLRVWRARELAAAASKVWSSYTSGTCTDSFVGGDHFTIVKPPHIAVIAAELDALG